MSRLGVKVLKVYVNSSKVADRTNIFQSVSATLPIFAAYVSKPFYAPWGLRIRGIDRIGQCAPG